MSISITQGPNSATLSSELGNVEKRLADMHVFVRERMEASIQNEKLLHAALDSATESLDRAHRAHAQATESIIAGQQTALVNLKKIQELQDELTATVQNLEAEKIAHKEALKELSDKEAFIESLSARIKVVEDEVDKRKKQGFWAHIAEWWNR